MPGNEIAIAKEIFNNKGTNLNHLGPIKNLSVYTGEGVKKISTASEIDTYLKSDDSYKKADFLINNKGISAKQRGGSKLQNKIQRKYLEKVFKHLQFSNVEINKIIKKLDDHIKKYHKGKTQRDIHWENITNEAEFKKILKHFLMIGSQQNLESPAKADLILIDNKIPSINTMQVLTLKEFYDLYKEDIYFAARPTWTNQGSASESRRALGLTKSPDNKPWVFNGMVCHSRKGEPNSGWDKKAKIIKTCYYFDISIRK